MTLEEAKAEMAAILEREPQLNDFGFGIYDDMRNKTLAQHAAKLRQQRDDMLKPRSLAQFVAARDWLRRFDKIKTINNRGTSYGLKHVAAHEIGYATNGVFIAAAIAEGFTVKREGPNARLNISTKAWRQTSRAHPPPADERIFTVP